MLNIQPLDVRLPLHSSSSSKYAKGKMYNEKIQLPQMIIDTTKTKYEPKNENTNERTTCGRKNENTNEQRPCVGTNERGARDRRRRRGWRKVRMVPTTMKTTGPPVQKRPNSRDKMLTHPAKHRPRMWHSIHCALISMRLLSQIASETNIEATGSIDRSIDRAPIAHK
jgi:hypothetical protein